MYRQAIRHSLVPLSVLLLAVGLAPPPAAAVAGPPARPPAPSAAPPVAEVPEAPPPAAGATTALEPTPEPDPAREAVDLRTAPGEGTGAEPPAASPAGVREAIAADGNAPVVIRLREQADLDALAEEAAAAGQAAAAAAYREQHGTGASERLAQAAREAGHAARAELVVDALQETAEESQDSVRELLESSATKVEELWIFNGFTATVDETALDALLAHPDVASVALDVPAELPEPAEPVVGEPLLPAWSLENINAPEAWGEYGVRGSGVVVGVLDSGVDGGHPALAGSWRGNHGDPDKSWYVTTGETGEEYAEPVDGSGHGTHVTGSVLGAPPGEVTGVAPDAEWIAVKAFRDGMNSTPASFLLEGMQWMLAPGGDPSAAPHVVNNSWGGSDPSNNYYVDAIGAWHAAGIVPVFANGNAGPSPETTGAPAAYQDVISVGAVHDDDLVVAFSSRGPVQRDGATYTKPDLSAPGFSIRSTWPTYFPEGPYYSISGTSMAAPHVTGVVALMLSAAPGLTFEEVRAGLVDTVRVEPHMADVPNNQYGAGIVDAYAAVTWAGRSGAVSGTVTGPEGAVAGTVTAAGVVASTDAGTGAYALRLPAGTHELTVEAYGYRTRTTEVTVTVGGAVTADFALDPAPEQPLSGSVTGPAGEPVPGARAVLLDTPVPVAMSGGDGGFALTAAEGSFELRVTGPGYASTVVPVVVAGPTDIAVTLEPLPGQAEPGWSQYQNNPGHTGRAGSSLVAPALSPSWTADISGRVAFASPVIADGLAIVGSDTSGLSAYDIDTGELQWTFSAGDGIRGAPAVSGGVVYTGGGDDGGVYALDAATGQEIWSVETPGRWTVNTAPAVVDGVVYASTGSTPDTTDIVLALDAATGAELWSVEIGPQVFGLAVGDGIVVAASSAGGRTVALDAGTGAEVWTLERDDEVIAAPSIADGTVYLTTHGEFLHNVLIGLTLLPIHAGSVLAVDAATGKVRWENPHHRDGQGTTPAVYGDLVIAGSHAGGKVVAYDRATGEPVWHFWVDGLVSASTLVSDDGYVIGGSQLDQRMWALDAATGELVWEVPVSTAVTSSAAYADSRLVTVDLLGNVRAYHPAGAIAGTVTGPDGPVATTVRAVEAGVDVATDTAGAFEITDLPMGIHTLEVEEYGYEAYTRTVEVSAGATATVDIGLSPAGAGEVTGVVSDPEGQPLAGATVTLSPTPLEPVATGADGAFTIASVATGTYQLVAAAPGYEPVTQEVTVTGGQATVADFTLHRFDIAVVSDFESYTTNALTERGWRTDRLTFDELVGNTGRYGAVVVVGTSEDEADADLDRLAQIVAEADQTGTSLVFLDQASVRHGSIGALSQATGDPAGYAFGTFADRGPAWIEDVVPHPITASVPGDARVPLAANLPASWFSGYSGYTLARLGTDVTGRLGGAIGYQRRTMDSNHILLPMHGPASSSRPDDRYWLPIMWDILADAVSHAAGAAYGEVAGQVTDAAGDPVPATVELVDGVGDTVAGPGGGYRLLLEPGEQTLRFRSPGSETVELPVTVVAGETLELDPQLPAATLGTIAGTVTDAGTGDPVAGATVAVPGLPEVATGADGRYVVEQVPGGSHDVTFTAAGYDDLVVEGVVAAAAEVTTVDAALTAQRPVVILGDRNGELTNFLQVRSIPAVEAGWEIVDDLDGVRLVVMNNPTDPGEDEFLAALSAFDEAGVSVVFLAEGSASFRSRGFDMLVEYTGNPPSYDGIGASSGPPIHLHELADHPLFEGVSEPVQLLTEGSEAAYFPSYDGIVLASIAEESEPVAGIGMAYEPRTPGSVHLILSGLTASFRNSPYENWTAQGQQIFLNAIGWATGPGQATLAGTVSNPEGEPISGATVEVPATSGSAVTGDDGTFQIVVPAGTHTVEYRAFGYADTERSVTVETGQTADASAQLAVGEVGSVSGVVSSGDGGVLAGVRVTLRGTPYQTVTAGDGSYAVPRIEAGTYDLEFETGGHVRTLVPVEIAVGANTQRDAALRVSPLVGVIDDSDFSNSRDRTREFLLDWGYRVEDIGFGDLERVGEVDLVVANVSDFELELTAAGLRAFEDAANRAGVPVLWMGQHNRGAIRYLQRHDGDPGVTGHGWNDGTVTATVVEDHPLVTGLPDQFELIEEDGRYSFFDEFVGTTVATLATGDDGEQGGTIGYRGRTASTVDVLLSTLSITTYGAPATRQSPDLEWTPEAERVYLNALEWALDAEGLGAEVAGTVASDAVGPVASRVEVQETGKVYQSREADGSFLVPLAPGTWTLEFSLFGHVPSEVEVTVEAGDRVGRAVTLAQVPVGGVTGTVTDATGNPVEGATVAAPGAPRSTVTGPDGTYSLQRLPVGEWTVEVTADGHQNSRRSVIVAAGQDTGADFALVASRRVALAGDYNGEVAALLSGEGYTVDSYRYDELDLIDVTAYDLAVLNGSAQSSQQPSEDMFTGFLDAAAAADLSVIFTGMYSSGSIRDLHDIYGDPDFYRYSFEREDGPVYYTVDQPHPIFAGVDISEPVEILRDTDSQQYMFYTGYSGTTIAGFEAPIRGESGDGVSYKFVTPKSVHLLLASLMAHGGSYGSPAQTWTDDAKLIYLNAVAWAIDATQADLVGTVTGGGAPVVGAEVTVVATGATSITAPDGTYALGIAPGTQTIRVSAVGFETAERTVEMPETGTVTLDIALVPLPRGEVGGVVTSADGGPVAGATLTGAGGPLGWTATTGEDGSYTAADLLEGTYEVTVSVEGYLPGAGSVTVVAGTPAVLDVTLQPIKVGVLGDVRGSLTGYLLDSGVPATELAWSSDLDLTAYEAVVVNGGNPDAATFRAVLAAADAAEVSLVFTGTWAVDRGGIRLLERYTDRVTVGAQGYGDGPVQLTQFGPDHPLFAGLGDDPATLIVEGGYYSVLDAYAGQTLAGLQVPVDGGDPVTGPAAGWDWRTTGSVEVLLSASAVTGVVGPGLGWTAEGGQLLLNAIGWAREASMAPPPAPVVTVDDPVVLTDTVTVTGEAEWPAEITVYRDGESVATVEVATDGSWSAEVPLGVGDNVLTAVASNAAGESPASAPVTVARWATEWRVRGSWPARVVTLAIDGTPARPDPAERAELVVYDADGNEVARHDLTWVNGFYLHVLRGLDRGEYTLRAELVVDGQPLVIDGPTLE